jgi:hypothetical protein
MDTEDTLGQAWEKLAQCVSDLVNRRTSTSASQLLLDILETHKIRYFVAPDKSEFNFRLKQNGATMLVSIVCFDDGSIDEIITERLADEEADYPNWDMLEEMVASRE